MRPDDPLARMSRRALAVTATVAAALLLLTGCDDQGRPIALPTITLPPIPVPSVTPPIVPLPTITPPAIPLPTITPPVVPPVGAPEEQYAPPPEVVPASDKQRQAELVQALCATEVPNVQCMFTPAGPLEPVLGPSNLLDTEQICYPSGFMAVSTKDTVESSTSLGVAVTIELGKIVKTGVEGATTTTWTHSYTTEVEDRASLPAYTVGFAYRAAPMLRATGELFIRETGGVSGESWNAYRLLSVVFDSPDPSANGHGAVAFVSRPMTPAEKASCPPEEPSGSGGE